MYLNICVYMFGELCERCGCFLELHKRDLLKPFNYLTFALVEFGGALAR